MKKLIALFAAMMMLASCALAGAETILYATNPEYPPFEYVEGDEVVGYDVDLTARLDAKTRDALRLVQADAGACEPSGDLDFDTVVRIRELTEALFAKRTEDLQLKAALQYLQDKTRY